MPEESTTPDLVERALAMFAAGDRGDIDAAIRFYAPDVVWEMVGSGICIDGAEALRDFMQDWFNRYDDYQWRTEQALDMGNGVVLVVYVDSGRPGGSTFTVQERGVAVIEWTGGMIVRVTDFDYDEIDEARAAAERLAQERG
ncbi:MAG TPA: nuclear transport factor 2 family protein [Solirubrobacteraceae bacterium]|nr:nuclear transport factor 2 family protein [Solirubrobacteraceae bacterium]